jgi:2-phospho-L-lactate guanylyltransferase
MTRIVVPFRGAGAKLRLAPLADHVRGELALAMLGDVVTACAVAGETTVVTDDDRAAAIAGELGAAVLDDPGEGQGAAVAAALDSLRPGPILVVNADVPCVVPHDLRALQRATPAAGIAYVPADDGTTNALGLPAPQLFAPLYGPGSAARFDARARELGVTALAVPIPNLVDDVDTEDDLRRVGLRAGPRTQAAISALGLAA